MKNKDIKAILDIVYPIKLDYNIILANGEFPHNEYLKSLLLQPLQSKQQTKPNTLICCDGAVNNLTQEHNHLEPDYIVGDCDSINENLLKQYEYENKVIAVKDQNNNDLTKAVNLAKHLNLDNIIILGATGLREDHTIANIAVLATYSLKFNNIAIISDYGVFTSHNLPTTLPTINGQQISFFTLDKTIEITCKQLKWELHSHCLNNWFSGTLNQATSGQIDISVSHDQVIIFRAFDIK